MKYWQDAVAECIPGGIPPEFHDVLYKRQYGKRYGVRVRIEEVYGRNLPSGRQRLEDGSKDAIGIAYAVRAVWAEMYPEKAKALFDSEIEKARETVPEKDKARFDKALEKALNAEKLKLHILVSDEVKRRVSEQQKVLNQLEKEASTKLEVATKIRRGVSSFITEKDFKFISRCLHPDHQPAENLAKFSEAFAIFKRLEPAVEYDKEVT